MESINNNENLFKDDEIYLKPIFRTLLRSKNTLIKGTLFISFLILIFSYFLKPIYRGKFEMDAKNYGEEKITSMNILSQVGNNLNSKKITELLILKSPAVLNTVFQFHKDYLASKSKKESQLEYKNWIKMIDVEFEQGSDIISVTFDYHDKKHISDVLNMISEKYKTYSIQNRINQLQRSESYLVNQIKILKNKSTNSLKEFNKFSIKYGLGNIDGFYELETNGNSFSLNNNIKSFSLNNNLKEEIKNNMPINNYEKAGQRYEKQNLLLENYESLINDLKSKLRPNSTTIQNLQNKIDNLKAKLKRPNEILLKYRELSSKARRDERFLQQVENKLSTVQMEIAREEEPWKIITDVIVSDIQIFPQRKLILFFSLFGSFIFTSVFIIIKDKRYGVIREFEELESLLKTKHRITIFRNKLNEDIYLIKSLIENDFDRLLIKNYQLSDATLLNVSGRDLQLENLFKNNLKLKIYSIYDSEIIQNAKYIFLIVNSNVVKYKEIEIINNYIKIYKNKINGWIYINDFN